MTDKTAEAAIEHVRKDIDAIRADISALAETLRSASGTVTDDAMRRVTDGAARANTAMRNGARAVQETANKNIAEHPLASVAVAFGIGVVIGKLLDRR